MILSRSRKPLSSPTLLSLALIRSAVSHLYLTAYHHSPRGTSAFLPSVRAGPTTFRRSSSVSTAARLRAVPTRPTMPSPAAAAASPSDVEAAPDPASLAPHAAAYAACRAVLVGRPDGTYAPAPVSLLPNAFPADQFVRARDELALPFNELVDRVGRDATFLEEVLGGDVAENDAFTARLLQMYREVYVEGKGGKGRHAAAADRLGIMRSDYMLHKKGDGRYVIKQVELNTVASSFGGLSARVADMHRHLADRFDVSDWLASAASAVGGDASMGGGEVPQNPTLECIPAAMALAHRRYVDSVGGAAAISGTPAVIFVVQPGETNTIDQRLLEFALAEDHGVQVLRMTLAELDAETELDAATGRVTVPGRGAEASLFYYRAGYAPTDYPTEAEWRGRERAELSRAAKCPALGYHLAGTKKVQQELARAGALERFFDAHTEGGKIDALRSAFAGLYGLSEGSATPEDRAAVAEILGTAGAAANYVLKPQREGGGYNYYGDDMVAKLAENVSTGPDGAQVLGPALGEFILMERLFPPQQRAVLLREGRVEGTGNSISELGCFGTLLVDAEGVVVHNEYAGFLLRTKFVGVDEGGVASGFATLSSPYIC